ncbi:MAG: PAS domain S-box protein [Planctomycetota bacterium]|jgi:PAS domain S-box-containing protein
MNNEKDNKIKPAKKKNWLDYHSKIILETSIDGFCVVDTDGRLLEVNSAMCDITGYSKEELAGMNITDIETEETPEQAAQHIEKVIKQGYERFETKQCRKDGKTIDVEISTQFRDFGKDKFFFSFFRDITKQKKAEKALRESEEKFKNLVEVTTDWVWETDKNGAYVYASPKVKDLLGYSPEEVIGKTPFDFMPETEAKKISKFFEEKAAEKQIFYGLENINYHKDGHLVVLETSGIPLLDEQGQLIGYRGIDRDITKRKKAEEALRESEERYKTLFQDAGEGILVVDIKTRKFKYANPALCKMLGYTEEEIKRMHMHSIHPKENLEHVSSEFEAQARGEKILSQSIPCLRKDGTIIYADINTTKVMIDGRECNVGFFTDITERKRIKAELENYKEKVLQTQKHAYVSSMGAIVAHQLNQPLTMINMLLGKALEPEHTKDECSPLVLKNIRESLNEVKKAASIISKFRQHFKDPSLQTAGIVNISSATERILSILSERAKQTRMNISVKSLDDLPPVEINETALEQILFVIIQNAIEAADGTKQHRLNIAGEFTDSKIDLQFSDDCCGIAPENLDKIFEPFFSIKSSGKGMGLGLDIVQQILISCGGHIRVESQLGKGTTFYVTLPVSNTIK